MSPFDIGYLVGLLVGEGYFGGDGKTPSIVIKMSVPHEAVFRWLDARGKAHGARLYGPYKNRGDRQDFFMWTVRGRAIRNWLGPILDEHLTPDLDGRSHARWLALKEKYPDYLDSPRG